MKLFLGYAPGVGKTYTMLSEANRKYQRGEDIVIGYFESHGRKNTIEQIGNLEIIPTKNITYNSKTFQEMDLEAIIQRNPSLVLVDELAHTNITGSKNPKRYMDVLELLNHGINVYSTVNLQHIESLNDIINQITNIKVKETIPDFIVASATVMVIDLPTDALQNRLKRGNIYSNELIEKSLKNFFRKGNLNALRELTLRQIADEVDEELEEYMTNHNLCENWHTVERVMVSISSNPKSKRLIRMGSIISQKYKCEYYVVYVNCTHNLSPHDTTGANQKSLKDNIELSQKLNAQIIELNGSSVSSEIIKFATKKHITKLIIGHSKRTLLQKLFRGSTINKILEKAKNIEIIIVPLT
ncbi:universal stress protein [uncultured Clostridium sp.]|uniref:universal stress protein n=1 Tax=uncultured Clostridium sp. TaxID=59620 RepID=UPI002614ABDF|nr:universal stress protein [uncultured Clostridium sp.]